MRVSMVAAMDRAVRKKGNHFVATTTLPGFTPSRDKAADRFCSDFPLPYASAVSNQLMPPFIAASTTPTMPSVATFPQKRPDHAGALRELPAAQPDGRYLDVRLSQPALLCHAVILLEG